MNTAAVVTRPEPSLTVVPAVPAQESISHIWALLGESSRVGSIYDGLPSKIKTTLCFHAGLKKRHTTMELASMESDERRKLLRAINDISNAIEKLAHTPLQNFK